MNGLVISGGGALGAWAGGQAQYLSQESGIEYDVVGGTSTGALLAPHTALKEFNKLYDAYTTSSDSDIWRINPFKKKKDGSIKANIASMAVTQLILGMPSLGDSSNLNKLVDQFLTMDDWFSLSEQQKDIYACVGNYTRKSIEYKCNTDYGMEFDDFKDWMVASACAAPFMTPVVKNNCYYVDGGFGEHLPLQFAIDKGCTCVDAIILDTAFDGFNEDPEDAVALTVGLLKMLFVQIQHGDLKLEHRGKDVVIKLYYLPRELTKNSITFDETEMKNWWEEGYNHIRRSGPDKELKLTEEGLIINFDKTNK